MATMVDQLGSHIDELLEIDPMQLGDEELHEYVIALERQRHRLAAVAGRAIGAWDQRMIWADNGALSAGVRLANEASTAPSTARTEVRRARDLRSMPATAEALSAGDLSPDHVDLLATANRQWRSATFADHEAMLVEQCSVLRFEEARRIVKYWCQQADAEATEDDAERLRESAHLDVGSTLDGATVVRGVLDPIGGAIVTTELDRLERQLRAADEREGVVRTGSQRRAAALVEMATRSATAPADGRRPKPLFTALVGVDALDQLCELATGAIVTPGQLVRWAGTADLETVLFDGPSTVVSVSQQRSFTGSVRRAVEVRDRTCQHPSGCDVPAPSCDVDHIIPRSMHGPTSQFNGRLECPTHNRNSDRHDHGAQPLPARTVTRLDEFCCRFRWQILRAKADDLRDASAA